MQAHAHLRKHLLAGVLNQDPPLNVVTIVQPYIWTFRRYYYECDIVRHHLMLSMIIHLIGKIMSKMMMSPDMLNH